MLNAHSLLGYHQYRLPLGSYWVAVTHGSLAIVSAVCRCYFIDESTYTLVISYRHPKTCRKQVKLPPLIMCQRISPLRSRCDGTHMAHSGVLL